MQTPKPVIDHREAARRHTVNRAWERLGLRLGRCDLLAIETFVGSGGGLLIRRQSDGVKVVKLIFRDVEFCLAYDTNMVCAKTIMPTNYVARQVEGFTAA